jgi:predicted enzyme related to lactoylglutathione lyase
MTSGNGFESLDFLYVPAPDISSAVEYYVSVLGGELVWKIRDHGTVVANIRLSASGPALLLASHLEGTPIFIYRVADLEATMASLAARGWTAEGEVFEIPHGPCVTFRDPRGQRLALYQRTRPEMDQRFAGRNDP